MRISHLAAPEPGAHAARITRTAECGSLGRFGRMSRRGLVVALLCGVLGLGLGMIAAYAAQPTLSTAGRVNPISAVSPSVPIDEPPKPPKTTKDIRYPSLSADLLLPPPDRVIGNDLATWTYHVPQGWEPFAVCTVLGECPPPMQTDDPLTPRQAVVQPEVRFRPAGEPTEGGYSLRVKVLDNTQQFNPEQMVATKIVGFRAYSHFELLKKTPSAAYFTYIDGNQHLRYNYFQWFAVSGSSTATLEMSVAGRKQDVPGLKALFNRFADNVIGTSEPYHPPHEQHKKSKGQG
jgi:hypothetical protein